MLPTDPTMMPATEPVIITCEGSSTQAFFASSGVNLLCQSARSPT